MPHLKNVGCSSVLPFIAGIAAVFLAAPPFARAEATRLTNPNAFTVEGFGRGLEYSVGYDRVLNDDLVAGFSFGTAPTQDANGNSTGTSAEMVPLFLNYYFTRDQGSVFVTGGAALVLNSSDVQGYKTNLGGLTFPTSALLPEFGAGYENRGDSGFLFRLAAYGIVGTKLVPWVGFSFGYAF